MSTFTTARLEELLATGCAACGAKSLGFRAYVDAGVPMMDREPVGKLYWAYDGERFVDGVFEVTCGACAAVLFTDDACPRCHADGGLAKALATENTFLPPPSCPRCENPEIRLIAFVPAKVAYKGNRAEKARTHTEPLDAGFHGYRVDCKSCGKVAERKDACPLCEAKPPLRARPA